MISVAETVENIVAIAPPTQAAVSAALNISLVEKARSPYWVEYGGGPSEDLLTVRLTIGRTNANWLLFIQYDPLKAPLQASVDLHPYGPVTNIDVNPRIPPEGTQSYCYRYHNLDVAFEFTAQTRRLRSLSFVRE